MSRSVHHLSLPALHSNLFGHADALLRRAREAHEGQSPAAEVLETPEAFVVRLDLPGVDPATVDVSFERDLLTIKGELPKPALADGQTLHRSERRYGAFQRVFRFGPDLDAAAIEAESHHGVLSIRLPKVPEAQPKQIPVTLRA